VGKGGGRRGRRENPLRLSRALGKEEKKKERRKGTTSAKRFNFISFPNVI